MPTGHVISLEFLTQFFFKEDNSEYANAILFVETVN